MQHPTSDEIDSLPDETGREPLMEGAQSDERANSSATVPSSNVCAFCGKAWGTKSALRQHVRIHTGERPFSCDYCSKTFNQRSNWSSHLRVHTGEKPYSCGQCGEAFARRRPLVTHVRKCRGEAFPGPRGSARQSASYAGGGAHACELCKEAFPFLGQLTKHLECHKLSETEQSAAVSAAEEELKSSSKSRKKRFPCAFCKKSFVHYFYYKIHLRTHTGERPYSCDLCGKSFSRRWCFQVHLRTHAGKKILSCEHCERKFSKRKDLTEHSKSHAEEQRPRTRTRGDQSFPGSRRLAKRTAEGGGEALDEASPFSCEHCGERFPLSRSLAEHLGSHESRELYPCTYCERTFPHLFLLGDHLRCHTTTGGDCQCDECGKVFVTARTLLEHKRIHTGEKPYSCELCHKAFRQKNHLKGHMSVHTGLRPFSCYLCEKSFVRKRDLKVHHGTHTEQMPKFREQVSCRESLEVGASTDTGNKPYSLALNSDINHENKDGSSGNREHVVPSGNAPDDPRKARILNRIVFCMYCNESFKWHFDYKVHLKKHTEEAKPYVCEYCPKSFSLVSNFRRHLRTHTAEKSLPCEHCGEKFADVYSLRKHLSTHESRLSHRCTRCEKTFPHLFHLERHLRTHDRINKVNQCDDCGKVCASAFALREHGRIHTGERPYSCDRCGQSFRQQNKLKRHMNVHTGRKRFACGRCEMTFSKMRQLETHVDLEHAVTEPHAATVCH